MKTNTETASYFLSMKILDRKNNKTQAIKTFHTMNEKILSIAWVVISMMFFCPNKGYAQSKFHFDIDYHYNLGFSTSYDGGHWGRSIYKMGGNSIHFTGRYDVSDKLSTGLGFGWDVSTQLLPTSDKQRLDSY